MANNLSIDNNAANLQLTGTNPSDIRTHLLSPLLQTRAGPVRIHLDPHHVIVRTMVRHADTFTTALGRSSWLILALGYLAAACLVWY
jgi:hypothetical protein